MNGKTLAKLLSVALVATAAFASGAFAHGGNNDPNAIHACVNRFGEVRILGFAGYPSTECPTLGGPWAIVHWSITGPSGPSGASGPSGPSGPKGTRRHGSDRSHRRYRSDGRNRSHGRDRAHRPHRPHRPVRSERRIGSLRAGHTLHELSGRHCHDSGRV
jgi:hypothetical protein